MTVCGPWLIVHPMDTTTNGGAMTDATPEPSVQTLAKYAVQHFETTQRGDETILTLPSDAPEWIRDLVYTAHGDFGPDDWRYQCIADALTYIHDDDAADENAGEFADQMVDVYTGRRTAWLASNLNRLGYCDEARDEFGADGVGTTIAEWIGLGQYMEASEVYGLVYTALEEQLAAVTA